jgi:protease PrsW
MPWAILAVVFAAAWVYAVWREDRHRPEPAWMVLLATAAGMLAYLAAFRIEAWCLPVAALEDGTLAERVRVALLIAGPVEEGAKFLAVLLLVWRWTGFDEPVDGLVYAAAAGAGFALLENLAFMRDEPQVVLARGPGATAAHVLFAALWGGALGHARHVRRQPQAFAIAAAGLLVAALAHGAFDLTMFCAGRELTLNQARALELTLLVGSFVLLRARLHAALRDFPFRYRRPRVSTE